jgi:hypothetical protein
VLSHQLVSSSMSGTHKRWHRSLGWQPLQQQQQVAYAHRQVSNQHKVHMQPPSGYSR